MILLVLSSAWLIGLVAAAVGLVGHEWLVSLVGVGAAGGFIAARRPGLAFLALACAAVCLLALARFAAAAPPAGPWGVGIYNERGSVAVRGVVVDEPEERQRSQRLIIEAREVDLGDGWRPTSGRILVTTRPFPVFKYGDRVEMRGPLQTPPVFETFDYREYLARRGVVSLAAFPVLSRTGGGAGNPIKAVIIAAREPLGRALARSLPEPEASLARGMLIGQRATIPRDLTDDFNRAGISHLIAISGYNVTLVAGLVVGSLAWVIGRRRAIAVAMGCVVAFVFLVGAEPSVQRAGLMGVLVLLASLLGRPGNALTAVAFAAAVLTLVQPLAIEDVAFQLSFASTVGLVLLARPASAAFEAGLARVLPHGLAPVIGENLGVTAASSLAVTPVLLLTFGRLSLVALPANLLAVPAFPAILTTSAATAVGGAIWEPLGNLAAGFARLPLAYVVLVGRAMAALPFASAGTTAYSFPLAALLTIALLPLALQTARARKGREASAPVHFGPLIPASVLAVALGVVLLWGLATRESGSLVVTFLDVGQGDAILIESPAGQRILVDGGPSAPVLSQALSRAGAFASSRIDLVVLTHAQDDHVTGLIAAIERFEIGAVLVPPLEGQTATNAAFRALVEKRAIPVLHAHAGSVIDLGRGAAIEVLWPAEEPLLGTADDLNNNSIVLRLVYGSVSVLLTGDIAGPAEEALGRAGELRATLLKVPHHGSDSSSTPAFLNAVAPAVAVVSAGAGNSFGHPSPTTLLRLAGIPVYRTDRNGNVRVETDGFRMKVSVERGHFQFIEPALAGEGR